MSFNQDLAQKLTSGIVISTTSGGNLPSFSSDSTNLELQGTDWAFMPTSMTTTQRNAMPDIVDGMFFYNSTTGSFQGRENGAWVTFSNAGGGTFVADAGSAAAPSYTFTGDLDTGFYHVTANTLGVTLAGALQVKFSPTASAVNFMEMTGGTTGENPILGVSGTDGNIGLDVSLKGTGVFSILGDALAPKAAEIRLMNAAGNSYTALKTSSTTGVAITFPLTLPASNSSAVLIDSTGQIAYSGIGPQIFTQSTSITAAQVRGMYGTPINILAAPGVGKFYSIHKVVFKTITHTIAYANGGSIGLEYSNVAHLAGAVITQTLPAADLFTVPAGGGIVIDMIGGGDAATITAADNSPVYLSNDTGAFTGGDGTMLVDVWYSILNSAS